MEIEGLELAIDRETQELNPDLVIDYVSSWLRRGFRILDNGSSQC